MTADPASSKPSKAYWSSFLIVSLSNLLFGYNISVVSGAMLSMKAEFGLSIELQQAVVSVTTLSGAVAALLGGPVADWLGRRRTVLAAAVISGLGVLGCGFAFAAWFLILARFVVGLGIGLGSSVAPLYVAETSPASIRGKAVSACTLFINTGILVSSLVDAAFFYVGPIGWRLSMGLVVVAALAQVLGFFYIPESPRWLVEKGSRPAAAAAMRRLRHNSASAEAEVAEIESACAEAAREKAELGGDSVLRSVLAVPGVRRALVVGCAMQFFQQATGISVVLGYAGTIMQMSGVRSVAEILWLTVVIFTALLVIQAFSVYLVDRLGRRSSTLLSLGASAATLLLLAISFQVINGNTWPVAPSGQDNSTGCASPSHCYDCIQSDHCGFCYSSQSSSSENGTSVGACLAFRSPEHPASGNCSEGGATWTTSFCPSPYSWAAVLGLCLYIAVYAPGMGAMPWIVNTEIFPQWARSTGNAASIAVNWATNLVTTFSFLSLTQALTVPGAYYLYAAVSLVGTIFLFFTLPETRGKSLEEVDQLFAKSWTCGGADRPAQPPPKYGATNKSFHDEPVM